MTTDSDPWVSASEQSTNLPIAELVTLLRSVIGVRLVAYMGGTTKASDVTAWAEQKVVPTEEAAWRPRTAFEAATILSQRWDPVTIQSWFKGMNSLLSDDAPARVVREGSRADHHGVLYAARAAMVE